MIDEGFSNKGIDIKTGEYKNLKKDHYFKDGVSLCGKYEQIDDDILLNETYKDFLCKLCLKEIEKKDIKAKIIK